MLGAEFKGFILLPACDKEISPVREARGTGEENGEEPRQLLAVVEFAEFNHMAPVLPQNGCICFYSLIYLNFKSTKKEEAYAGYLC